MAMPIKLVQNSTNLMCGISKTVAIMKKLMNIFVLVAAAAMALASCQKNEIDGPVKQEVHFTINAGIAETKTIITDNGDGTYTPSWRKEDKIGIFFTEPTEKVSKVEAEFSNTKEDGETASFEGTASVEGEGTFYAFYPSSAFNQHYGDGTIRLDLPASQKPTSTSFDPACDILVAQPCGYIADGETVVIDNLYFARLMSVLRVNLVGDYAKDQIVESFSVEVDVNANVDITGNAKVDYKNATISAWNNGNVNRNVVTATYTNEEYITIAGTNNAAYLVVAPVTIPSGTTLTFTIETENYDIVKTVTAPADMVMPAGNIAVINLTIAEENCTAKTEDTSDYSGEWLIAGKEGETWYAAQKYVSGNYLSVTALEFEGESILESDGLSDCYMHIEKVFGGDYDGMYTIMDAGGKYLSASSSDSNNMKAVTDLDENSYWDIEANDDGETYSLIATKSSYTRNDMRFNYNSGTNSRVSCYDGSKTSQPYLKLFSESLVKADTTPRIIVAEEALTQNVDADATELSFNYSLKNISGVPTATVAANATMTNVSATADNGTVTVTFAANEEESPKTATVTLSYEGAESVSVTITQAAKAAEGAAYYEKVTSAPADWSGNYLIVFGSSAHATNANNKDLIATTSVSITDNKIAATDALAGAVMTVTKSGDKYHMTYPDGKYFGMAKNASTAVMSAFDLTFIYTDSGVEISGVVSGTTYILYSNNGNYFRCYTDKTGTSGYTLPTLYKLSGNSEGEGGETPEPELQERNLAFSSTTATATVGEDFTEPTLNGATAGVTYSSSNTSVATVDETTGAVTPVAAGETTITATAAADATYKAGEASYTLTVSAAQGGGDEGGETTGGYTLITSLSDITTGQYVIAAKVNGTYYAMSNKFASKINGTSVTVTDNAISELDAVNYVVTITKNGTNFSISSGTNYLKYNSDTNLGTQTTAYNWTISEGVNGTFRATLGTSSRGILYRAGSYNQFGGYSLNNATSTSTEYFDIELFKLN